MSKVGKLIWNTKNKTIAVACAAIVIAGSISVTLSLTGNSKKQPLPQIAGSVTGSTTTTAGVSANYHAAPGPLYSAQIQAQNKLPGTSAWRITGYQSAHNIEGYASKVSVNQGNSFTLYISTTSSSYQIQAYRMGYYQGKLGHLVWLSPTLQGIKQPTCPVLKPSNTVECNWSPSYTIKTNSSWFPGDYLLKLVGNNNAQRWIPITVRNDRSNAAVLVVNAVTTWQAYNRYGKYDLYTGPNGYSDRATKVSFDRPYSYYFGQGAADFPGNELPLVALVEKMGLNVSYVTDVDLQKRPNLLYNHRVIISLGHDEYYSPQMRHALTVAQQHGTNLMFLGANAIFRRIRFESTKIGPDRVEVNYRVASLDPMNGVNNAEVTTNWPAPPDPRPESALIGIQYACNPVRNDMVITDPSSWIFANTGLRFGSRIHNLVGSEYDGFDPYTPYPKDLQILAHSPVLCRNQPGFSDLSYYTTANGAGVFATGTNLWVAALGSPCPSFMGSCPIAPVVKITENVLEAFGSGLPGIKHPSIANALSIYRHPPIPPLVPSTTTTTTPTPTTTTTTTRVTTSTTLPGSTITTKPGTKSGVTTTTSTTKP